MHLYPSDCIRFLKTSFGGQECTSRSGHFIHSVCMNSLTILIWNTIPLSWWNSIYKYTTMRLKKECVWHEIRKTCIFSETKTHYVISHLTIKWISKGIQKLNFTPRSIIDHKVPMTVFNVNRNEYLHVQKKSC
jgi:hypothetical protein